MLLGGALREWFLTQRDEIIQLIATGKYEGTGQETDDNSSEIRHRYSSSASINRRQTNDTRDLDAQKV